jgi:hypothetical protein
MDATTAVSMMRIQQQADVAIAAALKVQDTNPQAAAHLVEAASESADKLGQVAAEVAAGTGELLDKTV